MKHIYLFLAVIGAVIPLSYFSPFVLEHGLELPLFFQFLFINEVSRLFAADVIISAFVLVIFVIRESKRLDMPEGNLSLLGLCAGVSCALPLFLYLRERHLAQNEDENFNLSSV